MAKSVRYVVFTLSNGDTKMVRVKTTTESFIKRMIRDMRISVKEWEVI